LQSGSQKGSFFVDTFALDKRVLEGESEKKTFKKLPKTFGCYF
jgi:hypothetical protein